jgi:cofilin
MSSRSGVAISDECITKFEELKLKKKLKYLIFGLAPGNKEIILQKEVLTADLNAEDAKGKYELFLQEFDEEKCNWAIYDFDYSVDDSQYGNVQYAIP